VAGVCRSTAQLLSGKLLSVPMELISDEYGFSLADDGWHYFRSILADYQRNPRIALSQTTIYRFFRHPEVRAAKSVNDVLFLHDRARCDRAAYRFHFNTYPWGEWSKRAALIGGTPFGLHYDHVTGCDTRHRYG